MKLLLHKIATHEEKSYHPENQTERTQLKIKEHNDVFTVETIDRSSRSENKSPKVRTKQIQFHNVKVNANKQFSNFVLP